MTHLGSIQLDVPAASYHKRELGVVSNSALKEMDRSPAHYRAWVDGADKDSPAFAFGRAFHCSQLEPHVFASTYTVMPDFGDCRFKANKEAKAEWLLHNGGRLAIEADDMAAIRGMQAAVAAHPAASKLIAEGQSEVTLRWVDESTGLPCKSRADYWVKHKRFVVDLKSTMDASPEEFAKSVYNLGYHKQDALYRGAFAACGEPIEHFAIVAVEKTPPYAVAVYVLDQDAVTKGYGATRAGIERLAYCLEKNDWPSYSMGIETLCLPRWAI